MFSSFYITNEHKDPGIGGTLNQKKALLNITQSWKQNLGFFNKQYIFNYIFFGF